MVQSKSILRSDGTGTTVSEVADYTELGSVGVDGTQKFTTDTGLIWESNGLSWYPKVFKDALDASTFSIGEELYADSIDLNDTDPIDSWSNICAFTQSGAARPTLDATGGPDSNKCINFSGSQYFEGDSVAKALTNGVSYMTVLMVLRWGSVASGVPFDFSVNGSSNTRARFRIQAGSAAIDGRRLDADSLAFRAVALPIVNTWGILINEFIWGGGDCQGWYSQSSLALPLGGASALLVPGSWTSSGAVSSTDSNLVRLGTNTASSLPFTGKIASFMVLNHSARLSRSVLGSASALVASRTRLSI